MRLIESTIEPLINALGLTLQPWMASVGAVLVAIMVLPAWRRNFQTKQARKRIQKAAQLEPGERPARFAEILALVTGNPFGLVVVAEEALKRGLRPLAEQAVAALRRTGKRRDELRRLIRQLEGERPTTPAAEALAVERLREAGLDAQAQSRLERARARFPHAVELVELDQEQER